MYYRCHDRPFKSPPACPKTSIREEQIDEILAKTLEQIELGDAELALAKNFLVQRGEQLVQESASTESALKLQADQIGIRLSRLTDLLLDGAIEQPAFQEKQRSLLLERSAVEEKLKEVRSSSGMTTPIGEMNG